MNEYEEDQREPEEPEEYHYKTDTEKLADRGMSQRDFV